MLATNRPGCLPTGRLTVLLANDPLHFSSRTVCVTDAPHPRTLATGVARESGQRAADERNELMGVRERPQQTKPPTVKEIDALAGDEVDRLYHDSLHAYADSVRQPPGLIA
jgi:hypothetical protein